MLSGVAVLTMAVMTTPASSPSSSAVAGPVANAGAEGLDIEPLGRSETLPTTTSVPPPTTETLAEAPPESASRERQPASASASTTISLGDLAVHPGRSTTSMASSGTPQERRGAGALAAVSYPWQQKLPGWTISFHPGRSGVYGYTYTDTEHIEVFVRDGMSDSLLAHVIAHEIGHAVDVTLNSGDDRREWQAARGVGGSPWWPGSGAGDFSSGAGDFAESFAAWQVGPAHFRSELSDAPSAAEAAVMERLATG